VYRTVGAPLTERSKRQVLRLLNAVVCVGAQSLKSSVMCGFWP